MVDLVRVDGWLLAAIRYSTGNSGWASLADVIDTADWLRVLEPTYDDVSFSFSRLKARDLIEVVISRGGRVRVRATPQAETLTSFLFGGSAWQPGDTLELVNKALGVAPYPQPEIEDRTLGRLPELSREVFNAAVAKSRIF